MGSWKKTLSAFILSLLLPLGTTAVAIAAQSSSPNYQVNEVQFGSGAELHACGTQYCAKESLGDMTVGKTCDSSDKFCAQGGFNTDRTPSLTFTVNTSSINFGVLTAGTPKTATATFSVKSYLSSGYVVVSASDPPKNGNYTMKTVASPYTIDTSKEQFGINLVKNDSCGSGLPSTLGNDPVQVPDSSFSFGTVSSGYNTPCQFKYAKGDVIASSSKSSGETDYTISYVFNINNVTPGGTYTMDDVLVATGTY